MNATVSADHKVKALTRSLSLNRDHSAESERASDMVATLQARKEALEAKIQEKNEELKKLCLQEADLTGIVPPEIPLEPGEPPPQVRRRIGTSFSFPQNLINNVKGGDETLVALELECKVQTNIAEAALSLANDTTVNKSARRKHRLMYRQSQRRLMELETRLTLLRQGKSQQAKTQQIKKKPRPNTTAVDMGYTWNKHTELGVSNSYGGSLVWPQHGPVPGCSTDEVDHSYLDSFSSLHRPMRSSHSGTSQSSSSPRIDLDYMSEHRTSTGHSFNTSGLPHHIALHTSFSQPNIQETDLRNATIANNVAAVKKSPKRNLLRRQWDTQSAGGTLLPSQTYPGHSHQPNLSRTQSLGSVEANSQRMGKDSWSVQEFSSETKEKEWYETSLDSAPSPPIRTSSRLPAAARMMYQMQEARNQQKWASGHPALMRTHHGVGHRPTGRESVNGDSESLSSAMQQLYLSSNAKVGSYDTSSLHGSDNSVFLDYNPSQMSRKGNENHFCENEGPGDLIAYDNHGHNNTKHWMHGHSRPKVLMLKDNIEEKQRMAHETGNIVYRPSDSVYINIPEDNLDFLPQVQGWMRDATESVSEHGDGEEPHAQAESKGPVKSPTQPYYHAMKRPVLDHSQVQALRALLPQEVDPPVLEHNQVQGLRTLLPQDGDNPAMNMVHHPPHAITQNEITFDTIVPFESPQNHTVVQAGKWQPYREVSKPFEMSDFYKYSTKFRQRAASVSSRAMTPENLSPQATPMAQHMKGIYQPLKPMTCQPVERPQGLLETQFDQHFEDGEEVRVSHPEIV